MHAAHRRGLDGLARRGRLRSLTPRHGADFASNDYLGLAESPELAQAIESALARGVPPGAGGSRLLRGNHSEHEALEAEAAAFFGAETALYFPSGFMANYALFSTLPQRGDLIVHDALIHASVHDGMRASRAERAEARHNDAGAFEDAITRWRRVGGNTGTPWIAIESLYSMDGDRAPLADLLAVAERHQAILVIDEAHATGVLGPEGRGLGAAFEGRDNIVVLHTCGKALGVMGALICGPAVLRDFLVNRCRPLIYATAPSPLMAAAVRAALLLCRAEPERRERHARLVGFTGNQVKKLTGVRPSGAHIQPIIVGTDQCATALAEALQARGFDVRAIRPPTVPEGTARLRLSLTLNIDEPKVAALIAALAEELERPGP